MSKQGHEHGTSHLSDEQFAQCALEETLSPELQAHLDSCEACRTEVASFREAVMSFSTTSLEWSAAQPMESLRPRVRERRTQPAWAIASWAVAGCLTLGAAIDLSWHRGAKSPQRAGMSASNSEDSAAQIERDNRLLMAVYQATSVPASSPLTEYGLAAEGENMPGVSAPRRHNE